MKKSLIAILAAASTLTACQWGGNSGQNTPVDPEGTTYPRVQLIEHFTGEGCGYCPGGMDYIYEVYSANPDAYVWVSNHTYGKDEYTISGSNTIAKKLGVSSAPAISINRGMHDGKRNYHPYYTARYITNEATTATSMISITRTYNAAANDLQITINGTTSDASLDSVRLTIGITESGMVGAQHDYIATWEGWSKFTHTHAIRTFVTAALGDIVKFKNGSFSVTYPTALNAGWVDENCMIVAWITPTDFVWPVLNAAKLPVVEGSKGGEDIRHGGIEEKPVSDIYPESGVPASRIRLASANCSFATSGGQTIATLEAFNRDTTVGTYSGYSMFPYLALKVLLPAGSTTLPLGTYLVADAESAVAGNVIAGYRDDTEHQLLGSLLNYTFLYQNELYLAKQWFVNAGTLTVTDAGFTFEGTTRNGSTLSLHYSGNITGGSTSSAPLRKEMLLMQH